MIKLSLGNVLWVNILGTIDDKIENSQLIYNIILNILDDLYLKESVNKIPVKLGNYIENFDSQRKPLSSREREKMKGIYPYYGATEAMDYIDRYNFDGSYILLAEDGTVMDNNEKPIVQYVNEKFWPNNHTHVMRGINGVNNNLLYLLLRNTNIKKAVTGAVQLKVNQANLYNLDIKLPNNIESFVNTINPYFNKLFQIKTEIKALEQLKQLYLKKFFD